MPPTPMCIIDRGRPCGSCVADSPATCPYVYLLAEDPAPAHDRTS